MPRAAVLLLIAASCTRAQSPAPAPSSSALSSASSSALASASASALASASAPALAWPSSLPTPQLPPPGPIKTIGYPADVRTCLPDPATDAGFTRDGAELGYCMHGMATVCELLDRSGHKRSLTSSRSDGMPGPDSAQDKVIAAFVKESGLPTLARHDCMLRPPPLTGTWAYPDIVVHASRLDPSFAKGPTGNEDKLLSQPLVKLGGAALGEAPVYPLTYSPPHRPLVPPSAGEIPFNVTELNALALSPDGTELGIVIHANCMEYCDDFQIVRMPVSRFASLVYNDTGYRALQQDKLDRAADLFLRAAFIDPTRELPAYNLACAYARLNDPRAEAALDLAIQRGGDAVRARAPKDKDFASVRSAPWFTKLTTTR